jgi:hypothetical protein
LTAFPSDFGDLERFSGWVLETEKERHAKRYDASMEEIRDFYDTLKPRMDAVVAYLNQFPLAEMPGEVHRLFLLGLSLMEVSPAIEMFGRQRAVEGFDANQMVPIE